MFFVSLWSIINITIVISFCKLIISKSMVSNYVWINVRLGYFLIFSNNFLNSHLVSSISVLSKFWGILFPFFLIYIFQLVFCPGVIFLMIGNKLWMAVFLRVCFRSTFFLNRLFFYQILSLLVNYNLNWFSIN